MGDRYSVNLDIREALTRLPQDADEPAFNDYADDFNDNAQQPRYTEPTMSETSA